MAKASKRPRVAVWANLKRVRRGILHVRNRLLDDTELVEEEQAIANGADAVLGAANLIGSMALSLERIAVAQEEIAGHYKALRDLATREQD